MKGCRVLTNEEIQQLKDSTTPRDLVFLLTGLHFGLRVSETLALTFGDVSGAFLHVNSKKNSENITFPIAQSYRDAVFLLQAHYEDKRILVDDDTCLFLSRKGVNQPITRQQASQIMRKLCDELGIEGKVNTHSLRKSFVTEIYKLTNYNIAETKKYSRHKNLANLDAYIGTTDETNLIHSLTW